MTIPPWMMAGTNPIYDLNDGSFGWGVAGFDVDGDGAGGNLENDPDFQPTTTLKHADGTYVNSRTERGIVVPEAVAIAIPGVVMGCQAQVTDVLFGVVSPAVAHDIGPSDKAGEGTILLAQFFGVNPNPVTGGTHQPRFFYRIWPGKPAVANGQTYQLQPL